MTQRPLDELEALFLAVYGEPPALSDPDLLREILGVHSVDGPPTSAYGAPYPPPPGVSMRSISPG